MATTTFDPSEGPSPEQIAAETSALEQGEKIAQMQQEDRDRAFQQTEGENDDVSLIGGKFKSQDDLLKAYEQLQQKLGQPSEEDTEEGTEESQVDEVSEDEAPVEEAVEVTETVSYMHELNKEFSTQGALSEEAVDRLSSMDSKDLIKAYLQYNQQAQSARVQQSEIDSIQESIGGPDAYSEMIAWAAESLPANEIAEYNQVTNSGDPVAIKFAVAALHNRYTGQVGSEAPLVTGRKASSTSKIFRSHGELSRAIADPRYSTDEAYRQDVEARLARSKDLL
jgi:hypothetical protein